ncbi:glycosyltransferase family 2 protein [soil metagenome]
MTLAEIGITLALVSVGAILYPIVFYPMMLLLVHAIARRPAVPAIPTDFPPITVLVAAHNEERVIEACLHAIEQSTYPHDKIHVLVGDDGSTDRTPEILRHYESSLASFQTRRFERCGKNGVVNALMLEVSTPFVILTDADCRIFPDAFERLVSWMSDASVGCVIGRTDRSGGVQASDSASRGEASYRGLEASINAMESAISSTVTSNGHLYAMRAELLRPIPDKRASDDFLLPLYSILAGKRTIVDNAALVIEERTNSIQQEMKRTIRTVSGGLASISCARGLLLPTQGMVSWFMWSHRILRWLMPWFIIALFVATCLTVQNTELFSVLFYTEFAFVFAAFVGHLAETTGVRIRPLQLIYFFVVMNVSLLAGMLRYLSGRQIDRWSPSSKGRS